MEEQPVPTKRLREWLGWVVAAVVVVVIGMFVVPAWMRARCDGQVLRESVGLRRLCVGLVQLRSANREFPVSVTELHLSGVIEPNVLGDFLGIDTSRRSDRTAQGWEKIGPLTMCLDPRAYDSIDEMLIVGSSRGGCGIDRWMNIAFADQHIRLAQGFAPAKDVDALNKSLAFYEGLGIPMPEEMVRELREAMGVRGE